MALTRLLVGDDASAGAAAARAWAEAVAAGIDAEITVVRVADPTNGSVLPSVAVGERVGPPVPSLLAAAHESGADLIVVGRRGSGGFGALALGGTAHQLAEHSDRPVAVVPPASATRSPVARVAVGHDGSRAARGALRWAAELATVAGSEVVVVHALDLGPAFAIAGLGEAYATTRAHVAEVVDREWSAPLREAGVEYSTVIEEGGAAATLLAVTRAHDVDLLVVGRQSPHAFPGMAMGSVAHRALGFAPCPTVVIPDAG
jgi:nucleotide-binding universal stress UspA family protein